MAADDWKARAVPAVYRQEFATVPTVHQERLREKFGASLHAPSTVQGNPQTRRLELAELDADDYARPARIIAPSVPEGVAWRLRGLQRLVEAAPVADFTVEAVIPSAANLREHHMTRATRAKKARAAAFRAVPTLLCGHFALPRPPELVVLMVRQAPRAIDSDNCASALKAWRDGIADALGIDDRDKRVQWECEQEKCSTPSLRVYVVTR